MSQYLGAFYWVIQTLTTVGYGDMSPTNDSEKFMAILVMCFGVAFYSFIIGTLTALLTHMDDKTQFLTSKFKALCLLSSEFNLPMNIELEVKRALQNSFAESSSYNEVDVLGDLAADLQVAVYKRKYGEVFLKTHFLDNKDPEFNVKLITSFRLVKFIKTKVRRAA